MHLHASILEQKPETNILICDCTLDKKIHTVRQLCAGKMLLCNSGT